MLGAALGNDQSPVPWVVGADRLPTLHNLALYSQLANICMADSQMCLTEENHGLNVGNGVTSTVAFL